MKILQFSFSQGGICWVRSGIEARESLCPCPLQRGRRGREEKGGNCRKSQVSWIFSIFNRPWNLLRSCLCFWCRVFCVFRNLQKLILFGQKSAFCCRYTVHRGSGKTYLCFSRHASCNPINLLPKNRFMFLKAAPCVNSVNLWRFRKWSWSIYPWLPGQNIMTGF